MPKQSKAAIGVRFWITGKAATAHNQWNRKTDMDYLRYRLEIDGSATIVHEDGHSEQITEIPEEGDFQPDYGMAFGDRLSYTFIPQPIGWMLKLTSVSPVSTPLELQAGTDIGCEILYEPDKLSHWIFEISHPPIFRELLLTGWHPDKVKDYNYRFVPTSIGTPVYVQLIDSDEEIKLTRNIEW